MDELKSSDDLRLLTVRVDRLAQWFRPGLLCIGDAAHAMSPIGGVGIVWLFKIQWRRLMTTTLNTKQRKTILWS
jgi:hypothetical protein